MKLSTLFGLKKNVKSVLELQNQSLSNLLKDFPDLQLLDEVEIINEDDIIDRSERANSTINVRYFEYKRSKASGGNWLDMF
jgi:hypothetical protein